MECRGIDGQLWLRGLDASRHGPSEIVIASGLQVIELLEGNNTGTTWGGNDPEASQAILNRSPSNVFLVNQVR
jgi:hypothetical protein